MQEAQWSIPGLGLNFSSLNINGASCGVIGCMFFCLLLEDRTLSEAGGMIYAIVCTL